MSVLVDFSPSNTSAFPENPERWLANGELCFRAKVVTTLRSALEPLEMAPRIDSQREVLV